MLCKALNYSPAELLNLSMGEYQYSQAVYNVGMEWEREQSEKQEALMKSRRM